MKCCHEFSGYIQLVEKCLDMDKAKQSKYVLARSFDAKLGEIGKLIDQVDAKCDEELRAANAKLAPELRGKKNELKLAECPAAGGRALRVVKALQKVVEKTRAFETVQVNKQEYFFTTKKLKAAEADMRKLDTQYENEQRSLVEKALQVAATYHPVIDRFNTLITTLDVLVAFALVAAADGLCRPELDPSCEKLHLKGARHVLVEASSDKPFIRNDVQLSEERTLVITGPNMGGKSTYIRMSALITVMAQVGSFVPCTSATVPVFRNVMCRVGASDLQLRGISTFMSEMLEASAILKAVSKESLVVVDELGRGTSTYDGYGLAHAIAKHLTKVGCFTLFATHFHEMSRLADEMPNIRNAHMRATVKTDEKSGKKSLTFLYEVADGPTDQSYGVEVAEMVKFPAAVLRTAKRKAEELSAISGRHMKQARTLTPEQLAAVERLQRAKTAEEFAQLARADTPLLQAIAC